jgi:PAS domain S-box-containing protein
MQFYILSILSVAATIIWLTQKGRTRGRFTYALYFLLLFDLVRLGLLRLELAPFLPALQEPRLLSLLQLLPWSLLLLLGLDVAWPVILVLAVVILSLLVFWPETIASVLTWGILPAVPLVGLAYLRRRQAPFPIVAPAVPRARAQEHATMGALSREQIEQQRPILECIADGVLVVGDGVVEYVNRAAATIVGVDAALLVGQPPTEMLAWLPLSADSEPEPVQNQLELKGRTVQYQTSIMYDEAGSAQGTVVILRDVTAAQQAEQAKSAFLTTVSHELRTPLTAIKGYVELLQSGTGGEPNAQHRQFLSIIQRNVSRMVQLINGLIFVSSVKGKGFEYPDRQANLRRLANQIAREMQPLAAQNQQRIRVEIDEELSPVQADPIHVSTIIQELVANGVKYNRPGGTILIRATMEDSVEAGEFVVVSVSDEGIGISREDQLHIFDDFYRPDRRDEEIRAGGIGVGLSIVHALVEAYNGRIWVESDVEQGSTFTFILPGRPAEGQGVAPFLVQNRA